MRRMRVFGSMDAARTGAEGPRGGATTRADLPFEALSIPERSVGITAKLLERAERRPRRADLPPEHLAPTRLLIPRRYCREFSDASQPARLEPRAVHHDRPRQPREGAHRA